MSIYIGQLNEAIFVKGRLIKTQFETVAQIEDTAAFVKKWAKKNKLQQLAFVYCGTTINWPEEIGYVCIVGLVLLDGIYEDDDFLPQEFPRERVNTKKEIPEDFWTKLNEFGVTVAESEATYFALTGFAYAELSDGNVLVEELGPYDGGFVQLDVDVLGEGEGPLSVKIGYA